MKLLNKMRNTGFAILGGFALLTFTAVTTGCSDNIENGLYAADGSNIGMSVEAAGLNNGLLNIGSAQSSTVIIVNSTTRWTVEVTECEGAWCQIDYSEGNSDETDHIGDGTFTVEAAPNRSQDSRECTVTVYAIESDGTHIPGKSIEIHLVQDRQSIQVDYAGDVISNIGTSLSTQPTVTVKANQAWTVSSSHSWIKIIPGSDMSGNSFEPAPGSSEERTVTFQISVEGNPGTSVRNAELTISSPTSAFTPHRFTVIQEGSTDTFFITPTEVPFISYEQTTIEFQIYSPRETWSVSAISVGDWVTLDRTSGEASPTSVTVRATVAHNDGSTPRQASVVFTRSGNMGETVVRLNQDADSTLPEPDIDPHVSEPWLALGWSSELTKVFAYYSSPRYEITEAGVYYQSLSDLNEQGLVEGTFDSNRLITTDITVLKPNTSYTVCAYVKYDIDGQSMEVRGGSIYFTTPDISGDPAVIPGLDDNNPPSLDK